MTPERHQEIGRLYHAALELEPRQRAAFLDQACAGDAALLRKVLDLVAAHDQAARFMEAPALEVAAGWAARQGSGPAGAASALVGRTVGRYQVLSWLNRGGMGEVYLALDVELRRKAALKMLPSASTRDPERVRRFEQEAQAASALNHPHIITIYEIGDIDGARFIATEYVEGETLRHRIEANPLDLRQILELAAQAASALSAAHAAGILHRDIKPENLMMRRDGYLKVLDFGLAKLIEPTAVMEQTTAEWHVVHTTPGLMMGTISYMSPEQVKGGELDGRSDIFSLGVVLYELIAKKTPFPGTTVAAVAAEILHTQPQALQVHCPDVSMELERIVGKTLAKDREQRYQSAKDLLIDLKNLSLELEVETRLRRSPVALGTPETTELDFALPLPSRISRLLFLVIQLGYLAMYWAALQYAEDLESALTRVGLTPVAVTLPTLIILAMCGIAVRLYLLSSVGWAHPAAGIKFRQLFPVLLILDAIWAASPLLAARELGIGTALAGIAGLAYLPFAQRTLIDSIYRRTSE